MSLKIPCTSAEHVAKQCLLSDIIWHHTQMDLTFQCCLPCEDIQTKQNSQITMCPVILQQRRQQIVEKFQWKLEWMKMQCASAFGGVQSQEENNFRNLKRNSAFANCISKLLLRLQKNKRIKIWTETECKQITISCETRQGWGWGPRCGHLPKIGTGGSRFIRVCFIRISTKIWRPVEIALLSPQCKSARLIRKPKNPTR